MTGFYKVKISGTGMEVPKKILTNHDLEKMVDTSDEWITERTGMKERRIASDDGTETPSELAYRATLKALEMANLSPNDIDCIIFATSTGDYPLPSCSCLLQEKLGITNKCAAFDLAAACSGYVYGVNFATSTIQTGMFKNVLVVGAENLSYKLNYKDRNTCILFGDGCGVTIFSRTPEGEESNVLAHTLGADGSGREFITVEAGGSAQPITEELIDSPKRYIAMKGREMFKVAVRSLADDAEKVAGDAGVSLEEIDWLIPHQANIRIIEATAKRLGFPMEKVVVNIDKYSNTSAATIPMALDEAVRDERIKRGQIVLFDAFGAGLTSGATLLRY